MAARDEQVAVHVEGDGVGGIFGERRVGRAEIAASPRKNLSGYARTKHYNTNITIDLAGDEAAGTCSLIAVHLLDPAHPSAHADAGAVYHFRCVRTHTGWLFTHVRAEITWTAGVPLFAGLPPGDPAPSG
ncbi:nuclear transport factor 2 family protein [Streptomyces sp. WMMC500]|uniref:nuclear transport factor 2 family protein n=1 Tax=Streptomyces sp. WMMC500 TaxID=3015154 RepID=UPI00248D2E16|nr:nuclear transport factor 2 family protein [Streptomyces sp. WMMC500]WBB62303.1 nuclear transport factor 2 family protein [Streptomyces sp. WMMC500]